MPPLPVADFSEAPWDVAKEYRRDPCNPAVRAFQSQGPVEEAPNLGFVSKMGAGPILRKLKNEEMVLGN